MVEKRDGTCHLIIYSVAFYRLGRFANRISEQLMKFANFPTWRNYYLCSECMTREHI